MKPLYWVLAAAAGAAVGYLLLRRGSSPASLGQRAGNSAGQALQAGNVSVPSGLITGAVQGIGSILGGSKDPSSGASSPSSGSYDVSSSSDYTVTDPGASLFA